MGEITSIVTGGKRLARDFNIPNWFHQPHFRSTENPTALLQGVMGPKCIMNTQQKALRSRDIDCVNMGPTINFGPLIESIKDLENELVRLFNESGGKKINLIGHSLGGIYALHLARKFPEMVEQVILLGSPSDATPEELRQITHLSVLHDLMHLVHSKFHPDFIDNWEKETNKTDLPMPVTVFVAREDGIVDPHCCKMPKNNRTKVIVLDCNHFDLIALDAIDQYMADIILYGQDVDPPACVKDLIVPDTHHLYTFTMPSPLADLKFAV